MRTFVVLLLLANLTLFAYARLVGAGGGETARLAQQVQPDKIKVLSIAGLLGAAIESIHMETSVSSLFN